MINRVLLADNQSIFRAGVARVLGMEEDMQVVAQCGNEANLFELVASHQDFILVLSTALQPDYDALFAILSASDCHTILIAENDEEVPLELRSQVDGLLLRSVAGHDLVDCIRHVGRGNKSFPEMIEAAVEAPDHVGARVRERLTPRELQIVSFIVQGCKNKEIAGHLGTKEQVIKNYLRSIYDKIGVSDRLELALFTIHHRDLAEAAQTAAKGLPRATAA